MDWCTECPANCLECHMYNGQLRCMADGCVSGFYYNSGSCTCKFIVAWKTTFYCETQQNGKVTTNSI